VTATQQNNATSRTKQQWNPGELLSSLLTALEPEIAALVSGLFGFLILSKISNSLWGNWSNSWCPDAKIKPKQQFLQVQQTGFYSNFVKSTHQRMQILFIIIQSGFNIWQNPCLALEEKKRLSCERKRGERERPTCLPLANRKQTGKNDRISHKIKIRWPNFW